MHDAVARLLVPSAINLRAVLRTPACPHFTCPAFRALAVTGDVKLIGPYKHQCEARTLRNIASSFAWKPKSKNGGYGKLATKVWGCSN
eukprot:2673-Chlamydomonas_euryale.AAC.2